MKEVRIESCKEWTGATNDKGYGQIRRKGRIIYVHRLTWEQENGPIPDGMWVLHHCDNPRCYEITHLFLGTPADNTADMVAKGRYRKRNEITECRNGHALDEANTYWWRGYRHCRICRHDAGKRRYNGGKSA